MSGRRRLQAEEWDGCRPSWPSRSRAASVQLQHRPGALQRSGTTWEKFQTFPAFAAKQWHFFQVGNRAFLALAQGVTLGHIEAKNPRQSRLYEWDGSRFVDFQTLDGKWGYNWESFEIDGDHFLCYADHVSDSLIYKWDGSTFAPFQRFSPTGGRCFRFFEIGGERFLAYAIINDESSLYRWDGKEFKLHQKLSGPGGREFCIVKGGSCEPVGCSCD